MGEIVAAAHLAHVPPLVMTEEFLKFLSPDVETTLIDGIKRVRAKLDATGADTFVIFDTHWITTGQLVVAGAAHHKGVYTSDEVPMAIYDVPYDYAGAPELGALVSEIATAKGKRIFNATSPHMATHYATLNLLRFLHKGEKVLSVSTCQTAQFHNYLEFGAIIAEAIGATGCRAALFASGGMSHSFWPYDRLYDPDCATFAPDGIATPEAREMDERILALWRDGQHDAVLDLYPDYAKHRPEGWFSHYVTMVGALGGAACRARGRQMSAYENNLGTGQVHVWFDLADAA